MTEVHTRFDLLNVPGTLSVKHRHVEVGGGFDVLYIGDHIALYPDGHGEESEANLLGLLDSLARIRDAILQDRADRATTAA